MTISFDVEKEDQLLIMEVAHLAVALAREHRVDYTIIDASIDLTACHANGCRLNLCALKDAATNRKGDFGHDIFGIRKHIDHNTGKLRDCFVPRFAQ